MDIYLDFEATQFKENIIAIGATCKHGSFDCLVKPPKGDKITKFITELTGITSEMAENALTPDEAFTDFFYWVSEMVSYSETPIFYHAYGNMDKIFLQKTAQHITTPLLTDFVENLAESLIDDSTKVRKYFHMKAVGVYRALKFFEPETPDQDHDPLNDAIALQRLMNNIYIAAPIEKCPFQEIKSPAIKQNKSNTPGTIVAKQINVKNPITKKFVNFDAALDWTYKRIKRSCPNAIKKNVKRHLRNAVLKNKSYRGYSWEEIKEDK